MRVSGDACCVEMRKYEVAPAAKKKVKTEPVRASADQQVPYVQYVQLFNGVPFCHQALGDLRRYYYEASTGEGREIATRSGARRFATVSLGPLIERPEKARIKAIIDGHRTKNEDTDELYWLRILKYCDMFPPSVGGPTAPWAQCMPAEDVSSAQAAVDLTSQDPEVIDVDAFDSFITEVLAIKIGPVKQEPGCSNARLLVARAWCPRPEWKAPAVRFTHVE